MSEGWIKLHRKIADHWTYDESKCFSKFEAWIDILLQVNHKEAKVFIKGNLYSVGRGQSIKSIRSWAERWGWSRSKADKFFQLLEKDNMITIKKEPHTSVVTVCNYESYQGSEATEKPQKSQTRARLEPDPNTNKNEKNNKNEKEDIPTFEEFLEHAKQKAEIAEVELNESDVRLKYESWKDAGWKTGGKNSRKIKNWKNTLTNSIKYMSKPKTTKSGIYAGMSTEDFIKQQWSEVMADAKSIGDDIHE